jgi:acetoacetyl-CoA synthetase
VLDDDEDAVSPDLRSRLFQAIRSELSPRYVPDDVFVIDEVPRTLTGKKMEVPVKKILLGHEPGDVANRDAMANPGSLDWFAAFASELDARLQSHAVGPEH